jgi:hypothetical protein
MRNELSVTHMANAIPTMIFSLLQMAILPSFLKCLGLEDNHNKQGTHTRSTSNNEEVAKER